MTPLTACVVWEEHCPPCTDAQLKDVQVSLCGLNALLGRGGTLHDMHPVKMMRSVVMDLHKVELCSGCDKNRRSVKSFSEVISHSWYSYVCVNRSRGGNIYPDRRRLLKCGRVTSWSGKLMSRTQWRKVNSCLLIGQPPPPSSLIGPIKRWIKPRSRRIFFCKLFPEIHPPVNCTKCQSEAPLRCFIHESTRPP